MQSQSSCMMHACRYSEMPEHAILGQWARERRVGAGQCRVWWSECESPGWVDVQLDSCIRGTALGRGFLARCGYTAYDSKPGGKGLGLDGSADSKSGKSGFREELSLRSLIPHRLKGSGEITEEDPFCVLVGFGPSGMSRATVLLTAV